MDATSALAHLAAHGLPGTSTTPITVDSPEALVALAQQRHALSWVSQAVAAGRIANATPDLDQQLRTAHLQAVNTTMAAHAAAVSALGRLTEAGLGDVLVLKGCATAHLDYSRPTDRFSTDVDLLIPACKLDVLAQAFDPGAIPEPRRRRWQERYGKSTTVVDANGVEIDLHRLLGEGYFGLAIPGEELRAHTEAFVMGGVEARALDGPGRLIHTAIHVAASPGYNLNSARDIPQLVLVSGVDWRVAVERSVAWGIDALFAQGSLTAWTQFAIDDHPLVRWARAHRATGRQRIALRIADGRFAGDFLTAPLALPPHRWIDYFGPILFPSRAYLEHDGTTWATRVKSMLAGLRFW